MKKLLEIIGDLAEEIDEYRLNEPARMKFTKSEKISNSKTKLFLEMHFSELTPTAQIVSLALMKNPQTYFYAEFNLTKPVSQYVKNNIIPNLFLTVSNTSFSEPGLTIKDSYQNIQQIFKEWFENNITEPCEIWTNAGSYDWVHFIEFLGGADNIPSNIDYINLDFATLLYLKGYSPILTENSFPHAVIEKTNNALTDVTTLFHLFYNIIN